MPPLPGEPAGDPVAAFYDHHPYPPPVTDLTDYAAAWQDSARRRVDHHRIWPHRPIAEEQTILVAGCGTSQAAKYAIRHPEARVIGIDVSTTAIEHTTMLADRHGLDNLEVRRLPVGEAGELGRTFDLIVCTGVLHHLPDPDAGLAALASVLAPDGAMLLMVYARYGRTGVYMIQEYCRRLGIGTTADDIDDLVGSLRELPIGHPLSHLLRSTPDFQNDDALADALLNPRDRAYSVPELFDLLEQADLQLGRWVRQAPYLPDCGVLATIPHHRQLMSLDPPDQAAAVELFRGTMTRHSAVVHRQDHPGDPQPIRFTGGDLLGYVPIVEPTVLVLEERLPPGAAAALLNRAHSFTDLVLFVDDVERRLFDRIDGRRRIADIGGDAGAFVERLWRHDLVVIDAGDLDSGRRASRGPR